MKKLIMPCCAAALVLFGTYTGLAQDKSTASKQSQEVQQQAKTTNGNNDTTKVSTDTVRGKVEEYQPGKTLKVTVPGKLITTKSFDLNSKDWTYHVPGNIRPGQWVTVSEKTDNQGHKILTVHHSTKGHMARPAHSTGD
jgi:hypothetical protein